MAIWNGFPSWFGGQGSTGDIAQMDEQSDTYVKILNAQYQVADAQMQQNVYSGLANQITGVNLPAVANWQPASIAVPTTGSGVGTYSPTYYPTGTTTWTSTSSYPSGGPYWPNPALQTGISNPAPEIGDKMVMEWDGSNWSTTYIHATPGVMPKKEGIDYSLDEIEEATRLIEDLSEKRLEREAA